MILVSREIKSLSLAMIKLFLFEGIGYLVSLDNLLVS